MPFHRCLKEGYHGCAPVIIRLRLIPFTQLFQVDIGGGGYVPYKLRTEHLPENGLKASEQRPDKFLGIKIAPVLGTDIVHAVLLIHLHCQLLSGGILHHGDPLYGISRETAHLQHITLIYKEQFAGHAGFLHQFGEGEDIMIHTSQHLLLRLCQVLTYGLILLKPGIDRKCLYQHGYRMCGAKGITAVVNGSEKGFLHTRIQPQQQTEGCGCIDILRNSAAPAECLHLGSLQRQVLLHHAVGSLPQLPVRNGKALYLQSAEGVQVPFPCFFVNAGIPASLRIVLGNLKAAVGLRLGNVAKVCAFQILKEYQHGGSVENDMM